MKSYDILAVGYPLIFKINNNRNKIRFLEFVVKIQTKKLLTPF